MGGHEGRGLVKEAPESSLVPSARSGPSEKAAIYEPGTGLSPDLHLGHPSLQNCEEKLLLFISHPLHGIFKIAA